ncbi:MAG: hydroxymethylbilane synthase, partial [Alphaproteobacteria bacterium]|nr:hydroxymethylbilane synthase [Alphaproteobacteria bacterium]
MTFQPMRVGTRGSPLALWQARYFASVARAAVPALAEASVLEEHIIATSGDKVQDKRLADIGGKGLFAKEIHEALTDGRIDVAVHSLKDLETELPPGIVLAAVLEREDPRDALILGAGCGTEQAHDPLAALPHGALVGTASVRRQAQLLHHRPDLRVDIIRGNVQPRLGR